MKKVVVILVMMLAAVSVSAQHHGNDKGRHNAPQHREHFEQRKGGPGERHFGSYRDQHFSHDNGHRGGGHFDAPHGHSGHGHHMRPEVRCVQDWQELWNGCHVRLKVGRVYVYDRDDRVLWGDEIVLLPNGFYKVRNGSFWHVYTYNGDRLGNVWGDFVELMPNGLFHCSRAGLSLYYDIRGNERR